MHPVRPKNLNLFTIRFPIPAIISILHRITGVALFLFIPLVLWAFKYSLTPEGFSRMGDLFSTTGFKLMILVLIAPLFFHLVAGVRHLLTDIHIGDTLPAGRYTGWLTFIITALLLILFAGVWVW